MRAALGQPCSWLLRADRRSLVHGGDLLTGGPAAHRLASAHNRGCVQVREYLLSLALASVLFAIDYHSYSGLIAGAWS